MQLPERIADLKEDHPKRLLVAALIGVLVVGFLTVHALGYINGPTTTVSSTSTITSTATSAPTTVTATQQNTEVDATYYYTVTTTVTGATDTTTQTITTTESTAYNCPDAPYC